MKTIYLISIPLLLLLGCDKSKQKEDKSTTENKIQTAGKYSSKDLQGIWQSLEDKNSFIKFDGNYLYSMYDGQPDASDTSTYELSETYKNIQDTTQRCYLITKSVRKKSALDYEIDRVSEDSLSLIYLERGNTLNYHKIKRSKPTPPEYPH